MHSHLTRTEEVVGVFSTEPNAADSQAIIKQALGKVDCIHAFRTGKVAAVFVSQAATEFIQDGGPAVRGVIDNHTVLDSATIHNFL